MRTAFLFTGQGSQFTGMGRELCEQHSVARETLAEADEALGEELSKLCFEGPDESLALTVNTQPATLAVSIAAFRCLGQEPVLAAGHSLGEYSALTAAGSFAFADAIRLVRERAKKMQEAVPVGTGGMVVLRKMSLDEARQVAESVSEGVCDLANINAPGQFVLSGDAAAMDAVMEKVGPRKGMRLAVSVPFHSSLLQAASEAYAELLDEVEMADPRFPVYCNVDARPVKTADEARDALKRQFANSVLWQTSIERMLDDEKITRFVEFGPKPTLVRMVKQIANAMDKDGVETHGACTVEEIAQLLQ
ncbi:MAG: ACP S-malonyltransferase [Planctomycetota bacterium]|jgi:[acyl-carrier-protein] S-malonyltransferase